MGRSALIATVAVVALVLWMASGQLGSTQSDNSLETTTAKEKKADEQESVIMKVQTRLQTAENITREVTIQGQLEPVKIITLRAETASSVQELIAKKGQRIMRGEILAKLSVDNRSAELAVAEAYLSQANQEYNAALKLQQQGLQSKLSLEGAASTRESARAQMQAAELEFSNINIAAPIDALIEDVMVKEGDLVQRGAELATLVDNRQLILTGRVPQQLISDIKEGQMATANLVTGETLSGKVSYIASMAEDSTRSFRVEVLIDSPPAGTKTGISAQINIPVEELQAHLVSPAILALDDNGALGIKAIDSDNKVIFHNIEIVKTESNGAWVTGLPNEAMIITMGQGFVNSGEQVDPILESTTDNPNSSL